MQELLRNAGRQLEALLTHPRSCSSASILAAVLLALWFGRQVRGTERAKAALVQRGFQARVTEAVLIVSPHIAALVIVAAFGGVLHATQGREPSGGPCDHARRADAADPPRRVHRARVARQPHQGLGRHITFVIWGVLALHVLGWFDPLVQALDSVGINAGKGKITLWSVLKILFTVGAFILVAVWIARWFERRLMAMQGLALSACASASRSSRRHS